MRTEELGQRAIARLMVALSLLLPLNVMAASATRTSSFEYDPVSGLLTKEVIEPDTSNLCLVTTYVYDAFGNVTSTTTRNCNGSSGEAAAPTGDAVIVARTATTAYETSGRFPTTSSNALSQSETKAYDPNFGGVTSLTGPNGLVTTWSYDSFGRKSLETRADATKTKWDYVLCSGVAGGTAACPTVGSSSAKYFVQVTPLAADGVTANGAWTKTYFDMLNREIRSETQGLDGTGIYKDTQYDSLGRVLKTSRAYYAGGTPQWTTPTYDTLSRVASETYPDGSSVSRVYNGLTVTTTHSPSNQTRSEAKNSQGQVVSVLDAQSNTLTYTYDPFGNLTKTTDHLGNQNTLTYDTRGRKTQMVDRDMGTWSYAYNALGELVRQTDAKSQVVTMIYDKLGRMTQRNEPDLVSNWYYDAYFGGATCTKGIGKLCETRADNGYRQTYSFDSLGRTSSVATYIDSPTTPYTSSLTYNSDGRVATQTYPTGFALKNVYNVRGYLTEVRRNDNNALLWQLNTLDAEGHLLQQTHGNNVVTNQTFDPQTGRLLTTLAGAGNAVQNMTYQYPSDKLGNLYTRQDGNFAQVETFSYDTLNRLTQWQIQGTGITGIVTKTVTYNAIGNILAKSDVGTYTYNASGATSIRPHAVASITGTVNGVVNPTFTYDANGNLTAGAGRTVTYTSYNQPSQITKGANTLTFNFDTAHQRVKEVGPNDTTIFVLAAGLHYEKKSATAGGLITNQHFIVAYGMEVALYISKSDSTTQTRYFHLDHLNSIRVITNESGTVVERLAYDPWGKRRFANGTDDPNNTITSAVTDRGFTQHEHLDEVALIHMNGRVYDPLLGRFMSPDPVVQAQGNPQSYNRYSYLLNNPLEGTDPTGYRFNWKKWGGVIAAAVVTVVTYGAASELMIAAAGQTVATVGYGSTAFATVVGGEAAFASLTTVGAITAGALAGAAGGFTAGLISSGGDLNAAFSSAGLGAISGALAGGISGYFGDSYSLSRVGVEATAGGINSRLRGGTFAEGFKSSGILSAFTYIAASARTFEIQHSAGTPGQIGNSPGAFGLPGKIGGERIQQEEFERIIHRSIKESMDSGSFDQDLLKYVATKYPANPGIIQRIFGAPFGGYQGGPGRLFGIAYAPGSIVDRVVESFGGFHDFLNHLPFYNTNGTSHCLLYQCNGVNGVIGQVMGQVINGGNVVLAAPVAAGAMIPTETRFLFEDAWRRR